MDVETRRRIQLDDDSPHRLEANYTGVSGDGWWSLLLCGSEEVEWNK